MGSYTSTQGVVFCDHHSCQEKVTGHDRREALMWAREFGWKTEGNWPRYRHFCPAHAARTQEPTDG